MNDLEQLMSVVDNSGLPFNLVDKQGSGYTVVVRFRNQKDYFDFADLIKQPKLKVYNKIKMRETVFPEPIHEDNIFEM